jgi:hypothetical protein
MTQAAVTSPARRAAWEELVAADPLALVSQTPAWMDAMCRGGPYRDASRLYELPDGRRLVLPMVRRRGLTGRLAALASPPAGWGMGGLLASAPIRPADVQLVLDDLRRCNALRILIRPNPLSAEPWAAGSAGAHAVARLAHVLDLEGGFSAVWSTRFKSVARTAVRKAERAGLRVECDDSGRLVPVLYDLLMLSVERWASQQHEPPALAKLRARARDPLRKWETIAAALGAACRIWVAWAGDRPAAAIIVLQGRNASYTRGALDKDLAGPTRANYLLHKLAIEDACAAGCRWYHLGESGASERLAQFKTRFGAEAYPYAEYHVERIPLTRAGEEARALVKRAIGFRDTG